MKKLIPFSNGSQAMNWMDRNCETCSTKCHYKRNLELGFITGDITIKTAEFIGYTGYLTKYSRFVYLTDCQHKNKYKPKKRIDKNQLKLNI